MKERIYEWEILCSYILGNIIIKRYAFDSGSFTITSTGIFIITNVINIT